MCRVMPLLGETNALRDLGSAFCYRFLLSLFVAEDTLLTKARRKKPLNESNLQGN